MEQKPPGYTSTSSADDLTCQQATALLAEYVNDTLAPETLRAFQEHLRDCADCLAYLRTYRATIRALGTVRYEDMPAALQRIFPAHFGERRTISEGYLYSCSMM